MFTSVYTQALAIATILVCGIAIWKGGKLEQHGAGACLVAFMASLVAQSATPAHATSFVWLIIDFLFMCTLGFLGWRGGRTWPILGAGFLLLSVAVHVVWLVDIKIGSFAYMTATNVAAYAVLGTLAWGTFESWREQVALGGIRPDA